MPDREDMRLASLRSMLRHGKKLNSIRRDATSLAAVHGAEPGAGNRARHP